MDQLGFSLYRADSPQATAVQMNPTIIDSKAPPSSLMGATYDYSDTTAAPGHTYYYWFDAVSIHGLIARHGPICAGWNRA